METKQQRALISEIKRDPELTEAFAMPTLAWPTIAILLISFAGFWPVDLCLSHGALEPPDYCASELIFRVLEFYAIA